MAFTLPLLIVTVAMLSFFSTVMKLMAGLLSLPLPAAALAGSAGISCLHWALSDDCHVSQRFRRL
jgi:hypothetical protein